MRIRIRIYADREPDLYALYKAAGPSLTRKIFKTSLISYLTGQQVILKVPKLQIVSASPLTPSPMFDLSIKPEYSKQLTDLPNKSNSAFIKTLVRYYMFHQIVDAFGVEGHIVSQIAPIDNNVPAANQKSSDTAMVQKPKPQEEKISKEAKPKLQPEAPKNSEGTPSEKNTNIQEDISSEDISNLENSDLTGLAQLFSSIVVE